MLRRELRYPFSEGVPEKSYTTPFFTLRYRKRDSGSVRCAVVVGKKVDAHSNVRHTVKRNLHSIIEEVLPDMQLPFDIVLYTKRSVVGADALEVKKEVIISLTKAGIIQKQL